MGAISMEAIVGGVISVVISVCMIYMDAFCIWAIFSGVIGAG